MSALLNNFKVFEADAKDEIRVNLKIKAKCKELVSLVNEYIDKEVSELTGKKIEAFIKSINLQLVGKSEQTQYYHDLLELERSITAINSRFKTHDNYSSLVSNMKIILSLSATSDECNKDFWGVPRDLCILIENIIGNDLDIDLRDQVFAASMVNTKGIGLAYSVKGDLDACINSVRDHYPESKNDKVDSGVRYLKKLSASFEQLQKMPKDSTLDFKSDDYVRLSSSLTRLKYGVEAIIRIISGKNEKQILDVMELIENAIKFGYVFIVEMGRRFMELARGAKELFDSVKAIIKKWVAKVWQFIMEFFGIESNKQDEDAKQRVVISGELSGQSSMIGYETEATTQQSEVLMDVIGKSEDMAKRADYVDSISDLISQFFTVKEWPFNISIRIRPSRARHEPPSITYDISEREKEGKEREEKKNQ